MKLLLVLIGVSCIVYAQCMVLPKSFEDDNNEGSYDLYEDDEFDDLYDDDDIDYKTLAAELNITEFDSLEDDDLYKYEPFDLSDADNRAVADRVTPELYTPADPDAAHELTLVNSRDAPFNISHKTMIVIHGWLEKGDKFWLLRMKDKYLINNNFNVITFDWNYYATMEYSIASRKARKIGEYLGQLIVGLVQSQKIHAKDVHIAGHSLGAHIAGMAGKLVKKQLGEKIGRITAMDAAGPLFEKPLLVSSKKRLTKEDALFVDAIHTSSGKLGMKRSIGHADFRPNGGKGIQPGCGIIKNYACSHARSYSYYTESINSEDFKAHECKSYKSYKKGKCANSDVQPMGFYASTLARGNYYLKTNKRKPFAKG